jgi:nicotinate-nucleotide pyrophosphorylase (carboxylating)
MSGPWYLTDSSINNFIDSALAEDLGEGDHSSLGAVPDDLLIKAKLLIKQPCILAGAQMAELIFHRVDSALKVNAFKVDGQSCVEGDIAFLVEGKAQSILACERLVLNCMQRMSGIATLTFEMTNLIRDTKAKLMDTRKTTPNFRLMEKWAVHIGGGLNHRFALYDMIMLKDNHIDCAGGITKAVTSSREYITTQDKHLKIEVETRTLEEVKEALAMQVDVIMLDNMKPDQIKKAVKLVKGKCKLEASGGIDAKTIKAVAKTGVDYISMGALTHSIKSVDLSLKVTS